MMTTVTRMETVFMMNVKSRYLARSWELKQVLLLGEWLELGLR